ncbi:MAG: ParA family partition ATPase [Pseudomonadota bacterium]
MAHIIAVLNTKGGSGKSTLATNLADAFRQDGQRVLIVDSDPQGTARDWRAAQQLDEGEAEYPTVVGIDRDTLEKEIPQLAPSFDTVVIDGAAKLQAQLAASLNLADLVLIPVQPSAADVWAVSELVNLIKLRHSVTGGRPRTAFVISRQIVGTNVAQDVDEALQAYGLDILEARTAQRVAYVEALAAGSTVLRIEPRGQAAKEIIAIRDELNEVIHGQEA